MCRGVRFVFKFGSACGLAVLTSALAVAGQSRDDDVVVRAGAYVERYYERANSLVATEEVVIRPLERGMDDEAHRWRMTNEVRFERDTGASVAPRITRRLIRAKTPEIGSSFQKDCIEQASFSVDPLSLLLPFRRASYRFTRRGTETIAGVRLHRIDFAPLVREPPDVYWQRRCGIIRSGGSTRGRVWVEPGTGAVVRYEDRLPGTVAVPGPPDKNASVDFRLERFDTTVEYQRFTFTEPDETLLLPSRVEVLSKVEGSGIPRMRITRTFSDYRRFLGSARIIG
jgi:hypothetical protein